VRRANIAAVHHVRVSGVEVRHGRVAPVIVIYGGAQVDAADRAEPRFPEAQVETVANRIRAQLHAWQPRLVIGSAASGADLLVLEAARAEGIAARVVLPFRHPRFLETSVASRGDAWIERWDTLVPRADVEVLDEVEDDEVYYRTNATVLERAAALAEPGEEIVALVVRPPQRGLPSVSDDLAARASAAGYTVVDVDPGSAST
jgi:hypothetical protein